MSNNKKFLKRSVAAFLAALNIFNFAGSSSKALILGNFNSASYFNTMNEEGYTYKYQAEILQSMCCLSNFIIKDKKTGKYGFTQSVNFSCNAIEEDVFEYTTNNLSFIYIYLSQPQNDDDLQLVEKAEKAFLDKKNNSDKNIKFILFDLRHSAGMSGDVYSRIVSSKAPFVDVKALKGVNNILTYGLIKIKSQDEIIQSLTEDLNNLKYTNSKDL